ncbi:MAG: glycoside-pentoside-hexuronide (GPH):cation symporter [Tissierellaceae bacterium]|nr:glycoside-pentoside-hexuronide (GPH):cation symporter [Tissierellaceae bacterium]
MRKFGLRDKLGYMFGDFGNNFFFLLVSFFLMVFYTDVIGASPASVGVLFLLAKVLDAFIDLAWGRFIDTRKTTKQGKFRPWIIRMSLPLVFVGVLIFTKPPFLSGNALVIFSFSMYIIWGALYSTVNIPYGSLASVITNDSEERAGLSTFRGIGFNLASLFVGTVIPIYAFVNNKADGNRFFIIALIAGILSMICYVLCYKLTTERVIIDEVKSEDFKNDSNLIHTFKGLMKNKPLIMLIVISFIVIFSSLLTGTINAYLYKDYFNDAKALGTFTVVSTLATLAIASITTKSATKYGKKEISSVALIVSSIIYFILFLIPIRNVYLFIFLSTLGYLGFGFFNYLNWAFVTDVIDYHEYITGKREDGTVYAIYSFVRKIGQAVAGLGGGIALQIVGYEQGVGVQREEVADKIRQLAMITPAISYGAIALVLIFLYPLGKKRVEELSVEMKKRRS